MCSTQTGSMPKCFHWISKHEHYFAQKHLIFYSFKYVRSVINGTFQSLILAWKIEPSKYFPLSNAFTSATGRRSRQRFSKWIKGRLQHRKWNHLIYELEKLRSCIQKYKLESVKLICEVAENQNNGNKQTTCYSPLFTCKNLSQNDRECSSVLVNR